MVMYLFLPFRFFNDAEKFVKKNSQLKVSADIPKEK